MVAFFPNTFSKVFSVTSPEEVINAIMAGQYAEYITYIRGLNKREYDAEKKNLPAVTWSGTFRPGTRSIESMDKYTRLVTIDVDKLDAAFIPTLKQQLSEDIHVRYCFVSPSGTGIKIIVQVDSDKDHHRHAFLHLQKYFEDKYLIKVDPSGKDVSRLCYVSYDNHCVINQQSQVFVVDNKYGDIITEHNISTEGKKAIHDAMQIFQVCVKWVEKNKTYRDGEKNVFIHALACALNRCGVDQLVAVSLIDQHYNTPDRKWLQSIRSAYFHNMHEHGSVELKDMGSQGTFISPTYIQTYSENVAEDDLMKMVAVLHQHKVPNDFIMSMVHKMGTYYNAQGYIDIRRKALPALMDQAVKKLYEKVAEQAEQLSLKYQTPEEMAMEIVSMDLSGGMSMFIPPLDAATGGFFVGNFYELIGFGGSYKSILAQYWAYNNAINDVPVLYINAEMSKVQFLDRLCIKTLGYSIKYAMSQGYLTMETIEGFTQDLLKHTKNNLFIFNGMNFNRDNVLATIDHIYAKTGKKIKMVIMDGLSQMDQLNREEAAANIHNSMVCKEIVKAAHGGEGVAMIALVHCSGKENKLIRNTGSVVRGGSKMLTNTDGYFSTSLFIDKDQMNEENPDDIYYKEGKFCLRFTDKRGSAGVNTVVLNVSNNLDLVVEDVDYKQYEVKL